MKISIPEWCKFGSRVMTKFMESEGTVNGYMVHADRLECRVAHPAVSRERRHMHDCVHVHYDMDCLEPADPLVVVPEMHMRIKKDQLWFQQGNGEPVTDNIFNKNTQYNLGDYLVSIVDPTERGYVVQIKITYGSVIYGLLNTGIKIEYYPELYLRPEFSKQNLWDKRGYVSLRPL